jgi:hypothetical protein
MGDLIHAGLEEMVKNRSGLGAVFAEVEGSKRVMLLGGREVEVRGRCDITVLRCLRIFVLLSSPIGWLISTRLLLKTLKNCFTFYDLRIWLYS